MRNHVMMFHLIFMAMAEAIRKTKFFKTFSRLSLIFTLLLGFLNNTFSQTNTFNGTTNNVWETSTNWSLGHVPLATEDVVISAAKAPVISSPALGKTLMINNSTTSTGTALTISSGASLTLTSLLTVGSKTNPGADNTTSMIVNAGGQLNCAGVNLDAKRTGGNRSNSEIRILGTVNSSGSNTSTPDNSATATTDIRATGVLNISGSFSGGSLVTVAGAIINYNGSVAQTISYDPGSATIKSNNSAGLSPANPITVAILTIGDLTSNALFDDAGKQVTSTGTLNLISGKLKLGNGLNITTIPAFATYNISAGTTVEFSATSTQMVSTAPLYSNLILSGGNKTSTSGTLSVSGDLTINSSLNLNSNNTVLSANNITGTASLTQGTGAITLTGNWNHTGTFSGSTAGVNLNGTAKAISRGTNTITFTTLNINGTYTNSTSASVIVQTSLGGTGTLTQGTGSVLQIESAISLAGLDASSFANNVIYKGSTAQTVKPVSYQTLTIDKNSQTANLSGNTIIRGSVNFLNGTITTGANSLILRSGATLTNATSSKYVIGKLAHTFAGTSSKTFQIGKGNNYRPVVLTMNSVIDSVIITAEQFETAMTGTFPAGVNVYSARYWNLTNSGPGSFANYSVQLDGTGFTTSNPVVMLKKDGSTIVKSSTTTPNYTSSGFTSFSDFAFGESFCTSPTITCPANITKYTGTDSCGKKVFFNATAPGSTITYSKASGSVFNKGITTVTATATNACGSINCNFTVTVLDSVKPTITAPSNITRSTEIGSCSRSLANTNLGSPVMSDNCSVKSVSNNAPSSFPIGNTIVTWTVLDSSNNAKTAVQIVTIRDSIPPTITAPANLIRSTGSNVCERSGLNIGTPVVADNCKIGTTYNNAPAVFPKGTTIVTWTVVDSSGNSKTATQSITINDSIPPAITAPSDLTRSTSSNGCERSNLVLGTPTVGDNCAVDTTYNNAPISFPIGTTIVTWTTIDESGNSKTASQSVTIHDSIPPTISAPPNLTKSTDSNGCERSNLDLGIPVIADNCKVDTTFNNAPAVFPKGITIVTWTVVDSAGNSGTATQTITIHDSIPPTITTPANLTRSSDSNGCERSNLVLGTPIVSDNCAVDTTYNNAPISFPLGTTIVSWTTIDASGNSKTATQSITIHDSIPPTITAPADLTRSSDSNGCERSNLVLGTPIVSDNCAVDTTYNNAPTSFPLGTTIVTWTTTDASGNSKTASQSVTIHDSIPPTITAPANLIRSTANNSCEKSGFDLGAPVIADNCKIDTTYNNAPAVFSKGTTIVTWTVVDSTGNSKTATQTITIHDSIPPTISAPADLTRSSDSNSCGRSNVALGAPIVSDNCAVDTTYNNAPTSFPIGITIVTWTTIDESGNSKTASQSVTIHDSIPPTITAPANLIRSTANNSCERSGLDLGVPVIADNCKVDTTFNNAPAVFSKGTTIVTWTVVDSAGNSKTATQTITIHDSIPPTITAPSDLTRSSDSNSCGRSNVVLGAPIVSDNCAVDTTYNNAPTSFPLGTTIVTWTVIDSSGNSKTASQYITIHDSIPPTITAPANLIRSTANNSCERSGLDLGVPVIADNCKIDTTFNNAPAVFSKGTTIVTWTVVDSAGNSKTATQTITIHDSIPPTITAPSDLTRSSDSNSCGRSNVVLGAPIVSDNCAVDTTYNNAPTSFPGGVTIVTWTVIDSSGNSFTDTQSITIQDSVAPSISAPSDLILNTDNGDCSKAIANISFGNPVVSDNCGIDTVYNDAPSVFVKGLTTVTWTARDSAGNVSTATQLVTIEDHEKPVVSCKNITISLDQSGNASVTESMISDGITDNCGIANVTISPSTFTSANSGSNNVKVVATDSSGNKDSCIAIVTIGKKQGIIVYTGDTTGQYSDKVTLTAYFYEYNNNVQGNPIPNKQITFKIGSQSITASTNASGMVKAIIKLNQRPTGGTTAYKVSAKYNGQSIMPAQTEKVFTILREDARIIYTVPSHVLTSGGSSSATINLTATIKDINVYGNDPAFDNQPGDITTARVTLINRDNGVILASGLTVTPISASDLRSGTVSYAWNASIGTGNSKTFNIGIIVGNYYTRNTAEDNILVTVSRPLSKLSTGGGTLVLTSPGGSTGANIGSKINFGFNVLNTTGYPGSVKILSRKTETDGMHVYQMKSTSISSLSFDGTAAPISAEINGIASIYDITGASPVLVMSNATFKAKMKDGGSGGSTDLFSIEVKDGSSNVWLSSNYSGGVTNNQGLSTGNLIVKNNGSVSFFIDKLKTSEEEQSEDVKIYPNPAYSQFNVDFRTDAITQYKIEVSDIAGKLVLKSEGETIVGENNNNFKVPSVQTGIYFVRVTIGSKFKIYKMVIQQ